MGCGEHEAAKEALQLKRGKVNVHVAGRRRQLAQATRADAERSKDEVAREQLL